MQIQFNTGVCTLLLVKVPEDSNSDFLSLTFGIKGISAHLKWQLIGLSHELTEDQCKPLVRNYGDKVFENYHSHDGLFQNAKESFDSLLRHLKIKDDNEIFAVLRLEE